MNQIIAEMIWTTKGARHALRIVRPNLHGPIQPWDRSDRIDSDAKVEKSKASGDHGHEEKPAQEPRNHQPARKLMARSKKNGSVDGGPEPFDSAEVFAGGPEDSPGGVAEKKENWQIEKPENPFPRAQSFDGPNSQENPEARSS